MHFTTPFDVTHSDAIHPLNAIHSLTKIYPLTQHQHNYVIRISYTALHCLTIFDLYFERRSVSNSMGFGCSTPWCNVCICLANISGMPMPAPGLTRWVTSVAHLLAFVQEATWSHFIFLVWSHAFGRIASGLCVHIYTPFSSFRAMQLYLHGGGPHLPPLPCK